MSKPARVEKKYILVPLWIGDTDHPVLAKMSRRPVLIAIDELGLILRGQAKQMTAVHACVLPSTLLLLRKSVYVEIMFRYEETVYSLSGRSSSTFHDNSFWFAFDTVARKTISLLSSRLEAAGLIDREGSELSSCGCEERKIDEVPEAAKNIEPRRRSWPIAFERRVHHRYEMAAEVCLTVVQEGHQLECAMVDLSLSGCRLRFAAASELACGSQVEVQFIGNGLPLRLAATVQVRIDAHTAGMRFVRVSERMMCRLEELIDEIEEGKVVVCMQR